MSTTMNSKPDVVLVSWVSVNHGAAPLITAIKHRSSPIRSRVKKLYLCWRDTRSGNGDKERNSLQETKSNLKKDLDRICPEIITRNWETSSPPTDHAAIRVFAENTLKHVRSENPEAMIAILLSPGTPAMHAVWLVLGSTGVVEGPLMFIQTTNMDTETPVRKVSFDLDTWLLRYRKARPTKSESEDEGHLWDPARVKSPALIDALNKLRLWAPLRVPVLLLGERGTGKTTMANLLRSISPFQKSQGTDWPTVVCGQFRVNPQLARSELFGHVKGAFTGAEKDRKGLLELADSDSLFLDEIADLDSDTQRLLIAAIEGRGFHRLGDTTTQESKFRLICATNRSLAELNNGLLDNDFLDRIAHFVLHIPPLRECKEDLPYAWAKVLQQATRTSGIKPDTWEDYLEHPKILEHLITCPLRGNFRDLQRAAYHLLASIFDEHDEGLVVKSFVDALNTSDLIHMKKTTNAALEVQFPISLPEMSKRYENELIDAAMKHSSGNQSKAAELLGVPAKTLNNKIHKKSSVPK